MAEKRPARNLVVTEEDLPLVFRHLDDLLDDACASGLAVAEVGKQSDPAAEKVITRDDYPDSPDVESLGFAPEELLKGRDVASMVGMSPADVYDPCPCGSGKKFKFCCREKSRAGEEVPSSAPTRSGRWTPPTDEPRFQPIGMVETIAANLQRLASDSREMFSIVLEATRKPHVLDDATVARMENVLEERTFYLGLYREQIKRWRSEPLTGDQSDVITAVEKNLAVSQELTDRAREKVEQEIRPNTIDRVLSKSDLEIGVDAVRRLLAHAGR